MVDKYCFLQSKKYRRLDSETKNWNERVIKNMYFFELFFNLRLTAVNTCEKQYKKIKKSRIFAGKNLKKLLSKTFF